MMKHGDPFFLTEKKWIQDYTIWTMDAGTPRLVQADDICYFPAYKIQEFYGKFLNGETKTQKSCYAGMIIDDEILPTFVHYREYLGFLRIDPMKLIPIQILKITGNALNKPDHNHCVQFRILPKHLKVIDYSGKIESLCHHKYICSCSRQYLYAFGYGLNKKPFEHSFDVEERTVKIERSEPYKFRYDPIEFEESWASVDKYRDLTYWNKGFSGKGLRIASFRKAKDEQLLNDDSGTVLITDRKQRKIFNRWICKERKVHIRSWKETTKIQKQWLLNNKKETLS